MPNVLKEIVLIHHLCCRVMPTCWDHFVPANNTPHSYLEHMHTHAPAFGHNGSFKAQVWLSSRLLPATTKATVYAMTLIL